MAAVAKVTVRIPAIDTLLDESGFDVYYQSTSASVVSIDDAGALTAKAASFYSVIPSGFTNPMSRQMSTSLNWSHGADCSVYDITGHLNGSPHGSPILSSVVSSIGPPPSGPSPMPEGVAVALSYRGDYGAAVEFVRDPVTHKVISRPRSRYRSRIFLGPLAPSVFLTDPTTNRTKVQSLVASLMMQAFEAIGTAHATANVWSLVQWSRKDAIVRPITQLWVDDRPDYQRRRADQSTIRYTSVMTYPS